MIYYNEHDPFAAAWLRELILAGHIGFGIVDERSIEDVTPADLDGFAQCHFFAGVGVWGYALRRAGWSDDRPVWTGSCPCQPFSAAGKRGGTADERHLWPAWFHLIEQCRPGVVFGEQVEAYDWLDLVQSDLEGASYTVGAVGLAAGGFGAPHIRQRLFFVADSEVQQCKWELQKQDGESDVVRSGEPVRGRCDAGGVGNPELHGSLTERESGGQKSERRMLESERPSGGSSRWLGDASREGLEGLGGGHQTEEGRGGEAGSIAAPSKSGYWSDCDWLPCRDGKWRPVEPGTFPLAHGSPARVGRLRGYGNAIVAPVAEAFIGAYLDVLHQARNQEST